MTNLSEGADGEPGDPELPSSVLSIQQKVKIRHADTQYFKENWIKLLLPPECDFQTEPSHQNYFIALARVINFEERWEDPDIANVHLEHIEQCEACLFFIAILTPTHIEPITSHLESTHLALMPDYVSRLEKDDDPRFIALRERRKTLYPGLDEPKRSHAIRLMEFQCMLFYKRALDVIEKDPIHRKLFQLRRRVYQLQASQAFSQFMEKISLDDLYGTYNVVQKISTPCSVRFKPNIIAVKKIFEALWLGERLPETTNEISEALDHFLQCQKCLLCIGLPPDAFAAFRLGTEWRRNTLHRQGKTDDTPSEHSVLTGILMAEPVIVRTEAMALVMLHQEPSLRHTLKGIPEAVCRELEEFLHDRRQKPRS